MRIITYAQNFEDILLWRAFKNISGGFYIDVGGFHPTTDSVTKIFYDKGWSGINIEPIKDAFNLFLQDRPRDINLNLAVSNHTGTTDILSAGGFSSIDMQTLENFTASHPDSLLQTVATDTLNNILSKHHPDGDIHFLKIDVEGHEFAVLQGINLQRYRPWVIVFESGVIWTAQQQANLDNITQLLEENDYAYLYNDGLNRYFYAKEHAILKQYYQLPINVLDEYVHHREVALRAALDTIAHMTDDKAILAIIEDVKRDFPLAPVLSDM